MTERSKGFKANLILVGFAVAGVAAALHYMPESPLSGEEGTTSKMVATLSDTSAKLDEGAKSLVAGEAAMDFVAESKSVKSIAPQRPADYAPQESSAPTTDVEIEENEVKLVSKDPISTFSSDSDDGSYKLFKANLNRGNLIDEDMVRIEEFVNAFSYSYPNANSVDMPFSTSLNIIPSPWSDNYLLRVGVKGYEYSIDTLPPVNLTFLVDVSGSMRGNMSTLKSGLKMLVGKLRPDDRVSIVTYAGSTDVALKNTPIKNIADIESAIDKLDAGGSTNGEGGVLLAYKENERNMIKDGVNRVILMSDGDFNVGKDTAQSLEEVIKEKRDTGVTFSTIGIGGSNYSDHMMETMANKGNGVYTFIGDINDARDVFADRFVQTIKTIAKDVKYQIEFNPDTVKEYRLLGYENRALKNEDFNNDNVDAGDLPSGATTTAIYEITLSDQKGLHPESRYQKDDKKEVSDFGDELAQLKIRFKRPDAEYGETISFLVSKSLVDKPSDHDSLFAAQVAAFAQIYRNSDFVPKSYTYQSILDALDELDLTKEQQAFYYIVKTTKALKEVK